MADLFSETRSIPTELSTSGIYCIENLVTGACYIGSTVDIRRRWVEHRNDLVNNVHCNPYLQSSYNFHGKTFIFEVLEFVECDRLEDREKYWIDHYDSYIDANGYNVRQPYHGTMLEETKHKISKANKGKVRTLEYCKRSSESRKGHIPWNKGLKAATDDRVKRYARKPGEFKHSEATLEKMRNRVMSDKQLNTLRTVGKGRVWVNNGIISKMIYPESLNNYVDEGYSLGRLPFRNGGNH